MVSVSTGVELDRDGAEVAGPGDCAHVRIDEQARSDPDGAKASMADRSPWGSRETSSPPSVVTSSRRSGTKVT
jgi:hypothetical protein